MTARTFVTVVILISVGSLALGQNVSTNSPASQLKQSIAELQKSPGDQALRERIIKLALTLDPKPALAIYKSA